MTKTYLSSTDVVLELASWEKADFERAVRDGKVAFAGKLFGCEERAFTNRVKGIRRMRVWTARASLRRNQEVLERLL